MRLGAFPVWRIVTPWVYSLEDKDRCIDAGGNGMTEKSSARANIVAFIAILSVSAGTMLWLFWRFPLTTAIVTLVVLGILAVLGRLARSTDVDVGDMDHGKQSV